VVALAILVAVAVVNAGGGPHPAQVQARKVVNWDQQAVPVVISLVDDLRAIESHTADPTNAVPAWLGADDSRLRADVTAAQQLRAAPNPTVRGFWSLAVSRLAAADRTLHAAAGSLDPAAVALAHQQFATAGDDLLRLGQAVSPVG
jgi:hypothetical protein